MANLALLLKQPNRLQKLVCSGTQRSQGPKVFCKRGGHRAMSLILMKSRQHKDQLSIIWGSPGGSFLTPHMPACLSQRNVGPWPIRTNVVGFQVQVLRPAQTSQEPRSLYHHEPIKGHGHKPPSLITDKLRKCDAAHRPVMPTVEAIKANYANPCAEVPHQSTRTREYHRRGVASSSQAQRILM